MTTLDSYFDESALRHPERPALSVGGRLYSYRELAAVRDTVAGLLSGASLAGERVGVLCSKDWLAYGGLLGVLSSLNTYVPLNPAFPGDRLLRICEDASIAALLVDRASLAKARTVLRNYSRKLLVLATEEQAVPPELVALQRHELVSWGMLKSEPKAERPNSVAEPGTCAYLLFTSGSTGQPKGVPVSHANACRCIESLLAEFPMSEGDRVAQFAELSFDCSVADMFTCWKSGACLYAPSARDLLFPLSFVNGNELTIWSSVPTLANNIKALGILKELCMPTIRLSFLYGEALPASLAEAWQAATPSGRVVNLYGPTEAAIFATFHVYDRARDGATGVVPIGRPLRGFDVKLVDRDGDSGNERGDAAAGELLLSGPQVVSGYWRNEAATARAFVRLEGYERSWYRTGDLVKVDEARGLLFLGRCDQQVKVRGCRVELQEIESVLRRITGSDTVAVVPVRLEHGRIEDLVAYCRVVEDESAAKQACAMELPTYMVPRRIVQMAALPLNGNGKLDYVALEERARQLCSSWSPKAKEALPLPLARGE